MKWTCSHCGAINPQFSFKCHNCPNTCGDESVNKLQIAIDALEFIYTNGPMSTSSYLAEHRETYFKKNYSRFGAC